MMSMQQRSRDSGYGDRAAWQSNQRRQDRWQAGNAGSGLTQALGWFSIGLGLAQIASPGGIARMIGLRADNETQQVMRAVGMRELATGVGILMHPQPAGWVKARVGGDIMDLTLLGAALASDDTERDKTSMAALAVVGVTVADIMASQRLSSAADGGYDVDYSDGYSGYQVQPGSRNSMSEPSMRSDTPESQMRHKAEVGVHVKKSMTINRAPEELYQFWRNFGNLALVMSHVESITEVGERLSHWQVKAPGGMTVEWDAEIIEDQPNVMIAWQSLAHADVDNSGVVRFQPAPGGKGTEIHVELKYKPPAGKLGAMIAKLFGEEPEQQIDDDLRRFKQLMEAGEVVVSDATVHGRHLLKQRPAQPPEQVPQAEEAFLR